MRFQHGVGELVEATAQANDAALPFIRLSVAAVMPVDVAPKDVAYRAAPAVLPPAVSERAEATF